MRRPSAFAIAAILLGTAVPAVAADLRTPAPVYKAAPMPVVYNWTGFYIGGNVGGAWDARWSGTATSMGPNVLGGIQRQSFVQGASSFIGGGQIGYNWQVAPNWVFGLEADLQGTKLNGGQTLANPLFPPVTTFMNRELDWFGTVRGRVGYAWDRWLVYATGGFAYGAVKFNANSIVPAGCCANPAAFSFPVSASDTRTGWTVGAGSEWAFAGNWSVKAEYLYVALSGESLATSGIPSQAPNTVTFDWNRTNFHIARIGLNYRFDWGGPVVARY